MSHIRPCLYLCLKGDPLLRRYTTPWQRLHRESRPARPHPSQYFGCPNLLSSPQPVQQLVQLSLCMNSLNGPLGNALGKVSSLHRLDFSPNRFNDSIPLQLHRLRNLRSLIKKPVSWMCMNVPRVSTLPEGDESDEKFKKTVEKLRKVRQRMKELEQEYENLFTYESYRKYGDRKIEDITSESSESDVSDSGEECEGVDVDKVNIDEFLKNLK